MHIVSVVAVVAHVVFGADRLDPQSERVDTPRMRQDSALPPPIIVEGVRDDDRLEQTIDTDSSAPGYQVDRTNREFEMAERAAKCAVRGHIFGPKLLRQAVDGTYNSGRHDRVQDQLVQQTASCGGGAAVLTRGGAMARGQMGMPMPRIAGAMPISEASVGEPGILIRGALIIEVLRRYASDVALSRDYLSKPDVVARFVAKEEPRSQFRIAQDLRYFKVAICLVRHEPGIARRIVYGEPHAEGNRMAIARMIDADRQCVGGARKVKFDPVQFRVYLADALYRWTLAARGVDTLIPTADAD